jgi:hypothetical protein
MNNGNLPSILPSSGGSAGPGRAQNFDTMKLDQVRNREAARTSIGHIGKSPGQHGASSSIFHPGGQTQKAKTSINSSVSPNSSPTDDGYDQEAADRRRYSYIRKKIKERKEKEETSSRASVSNGKMDIKTGGSFKSTGYGGLHRQLGKVFKKNRTAYKHLSSDDKKKIEKIIGDRAKNKSTGTGINARDRRDMGKTAYKHYKSGGISRRDYKGFKRIIGGLE